MKKSVGSVTTRSFKRAEFVLAVVIAILLVGSLLSQKIFNIPPELTSVLLLAFITIKLYDIIKGGGSVFEDYVALVIIIIFGIIQFVIGNETNSIIIVVIVFILVYSVGLMPWVDDLLKSRRVTSFILSYAFFVIMIILLFSGSYFANNDSFFVHGSKKTLTFEDALYFSTVTFTAVGYGDIAPDGVNKLIASIEGVLGVILNIAFIGYILAAQRFKYK